MKATVPSGDELVERFNPELKARHFANKERRLKEMELNSERMKEWSRSDKPIWMVQKEVEERELEQRREEKRRWKREAEGRKAERERGESGIVGEEVGKKEETNGTRTGTGTGWGLWAR